MPDTPRPARAVLFDFDGTLADSFAAITASTNHVRRSFGLGEVTEAVVSEYVGLGLPNLMEDMLPGFDTAEAVRRYREHHVTVIDTLTKLMPGVAETLPALQRRGVKMAVCSNKMVSFTRHLVGVLGVAGYFDAVLGPDDVGGRAKPDPAMLLEGLSRLGVTAADAVYVGDMAVDVHTAKAAGIEVWLVPGGATGRESPTAAGPDRVLASFAEMAGLIAGG